MLRETTDFTAIAIGLLERERGAVEEGITILSTILSGRPRSVDRGKRFMNSAWLYLNFTRSNDKLPVAKNRDEAVPSELARQVFELPENFGSLVICAQTLFKLAESEAVMVYAYPTAEPMGRDFAERWLGLRGFDQETIAIGTGTGDSRTISLCTRQIPAYAENFLPGILTESARFEL
jgi:hypothetical protein